MKWYDKHGDKMNPWQVALAFGLSLIVTYLYFYCWFWFLGWL
jgi:hypothetical protein